MKLFYKTGAWIESTKVENGLMSGWKTTSIFGTLINTIVIKMALEQEGLSYTLLKIHGDDVDIELNDYSSAIWLLGCLNKFGFDISRLKNMIHNRYNPITEFLKTVSFRDALCAYPMRTMASVLFNKPWNFSERLEYNHLTGEFEQTLFNDPYSSLITKLETNRRIRTLFLPMYAILSLAKHLWLSIKDVIKVLWAPNMGAIYIFWTWPGLNIDINYEYENKSSTASKTTWWIFDHMSLTYWWLYQKL